MRIAVITITLFSLLASHASAQPFCPPNVDPTYCIVASATGGKVYSKMPGETNEQMLNRFSHDERTRLLQQEAAEQAAQANRPSFTPIYDLHR